jgi:hypothetical protein
VVALSAHTDGLPARPRADRDAAAIQALLVERLGFRGSRVIELKNPNRAELEDIFGRTGQPRGLLAERLKDVADVPVFVYVSGLGAIGTDDDEAYLLPVDAVAHRARSSGFALETLYQNLTRIVAGPVTVVLEVDFAADPKAPVVSPNAPTTQAAALPRQPLRGLAVLASADRDQRPLGDPQTCLSLFTRHLIEALSGHADSPPFGNGDGVVDTTEAFVHAALRTAVAAAKLSGVLQRPTLSQARPVVIGRPGAGIR